MRYPGGKNGGGAYQQIICQIPPHETYIEPFLGSGAVMRYKRAAHHSIGIDLETIVIAVANSDFKGPGCAFKIGCGISFLESHSWEGNEFVYCDPPYLISSRRQRRRIYPYELTQEEHERLLAIAKRIPVPVAISGYYSGLYATELKDWRVITWQAITRGGSKATEYLWMNYPPTVALHDYSYLGENRTERQRIKRKCARWKRKLEGMPILERQALLAAIQQMKGGPL